MMSSKVETRQLNFGLLQYRKEGRTLFTTCANYLQIFSLIPSHIVESTQSSNFTFHYKGGKEQAQNKISPELVIKSAQCSLAILVWNKQRFNPNLLRELEISIEPSQQRRLKLYKNMEIRLNGCHLQNLIVNGSATFRSRRKVVSCRYRLIMDSQIHYDCSSNKDGFVGAAIQSENQTWVGIHEGGYQSFGYGILFTKQLIESLVKMVQLPTKQPKGKFMSYQEFELSLQKLDQMETAQSQEEELSQNMKSLDQYQELYREYLLNPQ